MALILPFPPMEPLLACLYGGTEPAARRLRYRFRSISVGKIKTVVREIDPEKTFIIATDARKVFGEGFGENSAEDLRQIFLKKTAPRGGFFTPFRKKGETEKVDDFALRC